MRITEALFSRYTDFRSALIDDAVIKECETRLPCVLSRIQSERAQTAYVALLSNVSQPNRGDLLTMWLIDVERAHALRSTDEARWEERIFSEAIVVQSVRAEVSGEAEAERVLHQLFFGPVRKALEPKDHWLPFGSLLLQLPNTNFEIRIDDHPIHLNTRTTWRIGAIRPGTRRVTLTHPDFLPWQGELRIQKQVESTLQPELIPRADPRLARQVVGWGGAAMALSGVVVSAIALSRNDSRVLYCGASDPAACPQSQRWAGSSYDPANPAANAGVALLPIGLGLALAGSVMAGGVWLTDEQQSPWWPLVIGLGAGGAGFGLSLAVQ